VDIWKYFEQVAREELEPGQKRLVPVIGSGFNLQASGDGKNWVSLLKDIGLALGLSDKDLGITKLTQMSATSTWEFFITKVARQANESASEVETRLKKIVKDELVNFEKKHKDREFYRDFLEKGFRDIISLNFDRTLALQKKSKLVNADYAGISGHFQNFKGHTVTLFRHMEVDGSNKTRIWYPHGDTGRFATIKLGIREYGIYIKSIEEAIRAYMKFWIEFLERHEFNFFYNRGLFNLEKYRHYWQLWCKELRQHEELNWAWLLVSAPVVFLGCGLSSDEWPLLWTLHQRARIFARLPGKDKEPVFVFWNIKSKSSKGMTEWLEKRPANVILLPCEDWKKGWERVFKVLI
jgi:hypothetical protein